jgi:hypothetical protein
MLLPAPDEIRSFIDDENISGSTKSELIVKDNTIIYKNNTQEEHNSNVEINKATNALNSDIILKKRKRKLSHNSHNSLTLQMNIPFTNAHQVPNTQNKNKSKAVVYKSNSEKMQPTHIEELEFPLHNNFLMEIDTHSKHNEEAIVLKPHHNSDIRTYEVDDDVLGKIIIKTRVIESTEKLQAEQFFENKNNYIHDRVISATDLHTFHWDNIDEYQKKQARIAIKDANEPKVGHF